MTDSSSPKSWYWLYMTPTKTPTSLWPRSRIDNTYHRGRVESITVANTRPVHSIIADIERRILAEYLEAYGQQLAGCEARDAQQDRAGALAVELAELVGLEPFAHHGHSDLKLLFNKSEGIGCGTRVRGEVWPTRDSDDRGVSLEIDCSPSLAKELLRIIAERMAPSEEE